MAITTAASGVAVWLFAAAWRREHSYHVALSRAAILAITIGTADAIALAKPEVLTLALALTLPLSSNITTFTPQTPVLNPHSS